MSRKTSVFILMVELLGGLKMTTHELVPAPLTYPIPEGITIELTPTVGSADHKPEKVALNALADALNALGQNHCQAWTINRVAASEQLSFDLTPLPGQPISVKTAWDLTYALRQQPQIRDAEPSFTIAQDDLYPGGQGQPATATVAGLPRAGDIDPAWCSRLIEAQAAWEFPPRPAQLGFATGRARGAGICIAHPDSGFRRHTAIWADGADQPARLRRDLERDFVDDDLESEHIDGNHGLATASVLMSGVPVGGPGITGIAPEVELVPLRVAERHPLIPIPVLLHSGMRRLRDAIYYAIQDEVACPVISISLGWLAHRSLHAAVQEAERRNVIICAAAGNYVGFVVWPASYAEVIAVGGCTVERTPWWGSSRGRRVDISGPAQHVWRAVIDEQQRPQIGPSDGTSFAAATVAGVAALWLAHHGRDFLLDRYAGQVTLSQVFRCLLVRTAEPFASPRVRGLGAGIVNARRLLAAPLPTPNEVQVTGPEPLTAALPPRAGMLPQLSSVFDQLPATALQRRIATLTGVPAGEVEERLAGLGDELLFHLVTQPALRSSFAPPLTAGGKPALPAAAPFIGDVAHEQFVTLPDLSENFRLQVQ
jgi:hypothetical protein